MDLEPIDGGAIEEPAYKREARERREAIASTMKQMGMTVSSVFVPWSKSRNAKTNPKQSDYSLNWRVTLERDGRAILTTDYSAGIGHCPSQKRAKRHSGGYTDREWEAIVSECETGKATLRPIAYGVRPNHKKPLMPDEINVMYSLLMDSTVLGYNNYEDWALDTGYDPDSRAGVAMYRACLEIALRIRNCLGETALADLQAAFQDY